HAYDQFTAKPPATGTSLNGRLFELSSSGRTELWRAAGREFRADPVLGGGAGTFEQYWYRHRPSQQNVRNAHNLYVETLGEAGLGAAFTLVALIGNIAASRANNALSHDNFAKAASRARTAADIAPWAAQPWYLLAKAQEGLGKKEEALASIRTAVGNDPDN